MSGHSFAAAPDPIYRSSCGGGRLRSLAFLECPRTGSTLRGQVIRMAQAFLSGRHSKIRKAVVVMMCPRPRASAV
jgi:hypothetical protein